MRSPTPQPSRPPNTPPPHARHRVTLDPRECPIAVVEVEIGAHPSVRPAAGRADEGRRVHGPVLALVRLHGHPLGLIRVDVADDADALESLVEAARGALGSAITRHLAQDQARETSSGADSPVLPPCRAGLRADPVRAPLISVVVATRERPAELKRCLDSLRRLDYPRYEVIVVDNDPLTDDAQQLVRSRYGESVTYVREPVRGLAAAHNRGIGAAHGQILAFTDDDVVVDRDWLAAIAGAFASGDDVGCVTGLIVPAELETAAQTMLEGHGGFAKGFSMLSHHADRPGGDPLFPFAAGRLGSGANMAFAAPLLRGLGGFDPATGAGSPTRGGDDLLAFFRTVTAGYALVYQPDALVWHHHRRTGDALEAQSFGYGMGLGAFLAAALVHEPRMVPALLRRLPRGAARAVRRSSGSGGATAWPRRLAAKELGGMAYGPLAYVRSRRLLRR